VSANPDLLGGGGEATLSQKAPGATADKRKANELDTSNSGGSMEPAARRPAPGPQSGAGSAPLSAQAKGTFACTGEQAVNNGRQISYAEMNAVYAGVVTGLPVKGANAGVDSSATLPTRNGASGEGKGGRDVKSSSRNPPRDQVLQTGEERHGGHHCWRTLDLSATRTQQAKLAAQAHSQGYWLSVGTCCFEGSST
jgi:hypothetical protein